MKLDGWFSKLSAAAGILHGSRAFGGPLQLNLGLTNRCNIRCVHCYFYSPHLEKPLMRPLRTARYLGTDQPDREALKKLQAMDADTERCRRLIRQVLAMGTRRVQFGGNGEAFLHKDALELMAMAKRGGARCVVNTNGTLLDRDAADALVDMGFDELRVTTLADNPEVYRDTHPAAGPDLFEKLSANLAYFAERKKQVGAKYPKMTLVCIVLAQTAGRLVEFAEFAARVGANSVLYKSVDDCGDAGLRKVVPTAEQSETIRGQLIDAGACLESKNIRHNIGHFLSAFGRTLSTRDLYAHVPCSYGWLATMVESDGLVYTCCRNNLPIGNLKQEDFTSIWFGKAYREFRAQASRIPSRGTPVPGCDCFRCVHHAANLEAYRILHPLKSRSRRIRQLESLMPGGGAES